MAIFSPAWLSAQAPVSITPKLAGMHPVLARAGSSHFVNATARSMKLIRCENRQSGLHVLEVLAVLAGLFVLASLFLPSLARSRKAPLIACGSQLKQMALAQIVWAGDHEFTNAFLAQVSTNFGGFRELLSPGTLAQFYRTLSNELVNPRILACPSDKEREPADDFASLTTNHLSYFLNMDARPGVENAENVLHGDRHLAFTPVMRGQLVTATTNLSLGWTKAKNVGHGSIGNIALADGSFLTTTDRDLTEHLLRAPRTPTHRLLFP